MLHRVTQATVAQEIIRACFCWDTSEHGGLFGWELLAKFTSTLGNLVRVNPSVEIFLPIILLGIQ